MADWWRTELVDTGKLPLFLCAVAFLVTFVVTRIVVRAIRSGTGTLKNNVVGGVHIHHVVPGIVLMVVGGLAGLGAQAQGWRAVAGVAFGIGLALVLDEFALILHLEDVYWSEQGRTSVDAVLLAGGVMVLVLLGADPFSTDGSPDLGSALTVIALDLGLAVVSFAKGKLATGIIGVVVPLVALVGAVRIARPGSPWARRRYPAGSRARAKSEARELAFDARWRSKIRGFQDHVAGFGS